MFKATPYVPRPARAIPPGLFKCNCCGRTKPAGKRQPGTPDVAPVCTACYPLTQYAGNPWANPLGPSADFTEGGMTCPNR